MIEPASRKPAPHPARRGLGRWGAAALALLAVALAIPLDARPDDAEGPAASLLAAAERRARGGDVAGALGDYEQLVGQFPDSPQAPEALLRMAEGQLSLGDAAAALATAERLVMTYPRRPQAAGGLLIEGRIRSRQPAGPEDLAGARKTLEKVWLLFPADGYPSLEARGAARVLDGQIALRLGRDLEAASSFLRVVEKEPRSRWTADAYVGLAAAFARTGDWRAAAESLQEALAVEEASDSTRALAGRRLSLLHRRLLRPAIGEPLWSGARGVPVAGAPLKRLAGVAASDRGRLLLVDAGSDQLLVVSGDGDTESRWPVRNGERPSWGRDGIARVAARDGVLLPGDGSVRFRVPGKEKELDGIRAVEIGPFGRWVLLASRSDGVLSYAPDRASARPVLRGDGDPVDLATDDRDRLYVLERKGKRVLRIDPHDDSRDSVASGAWKQAVALDVDALGFVHVLDAGTGRVHTYAPDGEQVEVVGPLLPGGVELRKPEDLAAAGDGRLFVADARAGLVVLE